jgi:hypothetical protein
VSRVCTFELINSTLLNFSGVIVFHPDREPD